MRTQSNHITAVIGQCTHSASSSPVYFSHDTQSEHVQSHCSVRCYDHIPLTAQFAATVLGKKNCVYAIADSSLQITEIVWHPALHALSFGGWCKQKKHRRASTGRMDGSSTSFHSASAYCFVPQIAFAAAVRHFDFR